MSTLTACALDDLSGYYGDKHFFTDAFNCKSQYKTGAVVKNKSIILYIGSINII